jgi:pyruvate/2-oxoglutarate dehydrogenase complex dihydrolipoamide dehydrogenase (E3) component
MSVDYDLVVIGNTPAGRYAASMASTLKARVALVEQDLTTFEPAAIDPDLGVALKLHRQHELSRLAIAGIDVVTGTGRFQRHRQHCVFAVPERVLRSRAYLLALDSCPQIPQIPGLTEVEYLTLGTDGRSVSPLFLQQQQESQHHWLILGSEPAGLACAQRMRRLGCAVTLITHQSCLLPTEDREVVRWLQAQLEAEGVQILTQTQVIRIQQPSDQIEIAVASGETVLGDRLLLATGQQPQIADLNLEVVGVTWQPLPHYNPRLQTTNSRIYACGEFWGGYTLEQVACYEASIAVKNALFFPGFTVDYQNIPWAIETDPPLARVGLTETQATKRYGKDVWIFRQSLTRLLKSQNQELTGFCKMIIRPQGKILGVHLIGAEAPAAAATIALAMQHQLQIGAIAQLLPVTPLWREILMLIAAEWQHQSLQRHPWPQDWLESFFYCRRSWLS